LTRCIKIGTYKTPEYLKALKLDVVLAIF